jgi:hypothetical protein
MDRVDIYNSLAKHINNKDAFLDSSDLCQLM